MKHVLIDVPVSEPVMAQLDARGDLSLSVADPIVEEEVARPAEMIADAEILFCMFPPTNIDDAQALKFIQICSSGYTQLLGLDLPGRGIRAANAAGVFDTAIAEWNVAMMVNLARNLRQMIRNQDSGVWDRAAQFQREIRGSTVGIWGYGGIGRETARLAKACGLRVHAMTRSGVKPRENVYCVSGAGDLAGELPDRVFTQEHKSEFLGGLDFLILAMPLNEANEGIVGAAELRELPEHAFLLNPARGPLVDEEALIAALRDGGIAGAALDTHFAYPMPPDHPLWRMANVIMTPHISGSSKSPFYITRIWGLFAQNMDRLLAGQPLLNELSLESLQEA